MAQEKIMLPFRVEPAPPYHTLFFHFRQGCKKRIVEDPSREEILADLAGNLNHTLTEFLHMRDSHSLIVLPSKYHLATLFFQKKMTSVFTHGSGFDGLFDVIRGERLPVSPDQKIPSEGGKKTDLLLVDTDNFTGYYLNDQYLDLVRSAYKDACLHLDISTSILNRSITFDRYDSIIFNTHYIFGLYPGLIFLLLKNDHPHERFTAILHSKRFVSDQQGTYCHREVDLMSLFTIEQVCRDMINRDIQIIKNETIFKSILLYNAIDRSRRFDLIIEEEEKRSSSIIAARYLMSAEDAASFFRKAGVAVNIDHRKETDTVVRIGNFPVHSKEQAGYLADVIEGV